MFVPEKLYREITQLMPIACVDLLVIDEGGRVLLLKRRNHPGKGRWWLPGGRIHMGEARAASAVRKLSEECGLTFKSGIPFELMTEDHLLPDGLGGISHTISTVFRVLVDSNAPIQLDSQSERSEWRFPLEWLDDDIDPFVRKVLNTLELAV